MPATYKVLGQSIPVAVTLTTLYTVPAAAYAVTSTLVICNTGLTAVVRVAVRPAGAAIATQHYIAYNLPVSQNDTVFLTLGMTLATTDVVSVYSSTATVAFSLFGSEVT